jgi:hypothetical protein
MQSNIFFIQETYMTVPMQNEHFPIFNCISNCNKHGAMILVKKHLAILEHIHFEEQSVEVIVERLTINVFHIVIINIYIAPHEILRRIVNSIAKVLCNFHLNEIIVILGDFNIDMSQCNGKTKKLENYMHSHNLHFFLDKEKICTKNVN